MRIISGSAKGRRLIVPVAVTRPSSDRLREAVFNVIQNLIGEARVLDLCAGTGALGLEALSRGARAADFVESDSGACRVIRQNLQATQLSSGNVIKADVLSFLMRDRSTSYDLIFADPPYASTSLAEGARIVNLAAEILSHRHLPEMLRQSGLLILETEKDQHLPVNPSGLELVTMKSYGKSAVHYFRKLDD